MEEDLDAEENLEDYDQEQEESEETEESDDSAPQFSQIKHLLKRKQLETNQQQHQQDEDAEGLAPETNEHKMSKWVKAADKINRIMQSAAGVATKEAQMSIPGQSYLLNSYAFHSRQIINTLTAFLPAGYEKGKIESIFVDLPNNDNMHQDLGLFSESTDKIRKRVLISSTFATAFRTKHVLRIFQDLRNCKALTPQLFKRSQAAGSNAQTAAGSATAAVQVQHTSAAMGLTQQSNLLTHDLQNITVPSTSLPYQQRTFRKELTNTIALLVSKYDPNYQTMTATSNYKKPTLIQLPSMPEPPGRRPKNLDPDDFSDDEQYYKHRALMLKYKSWQYSLLNAKNVVQIPFETIESPTKDSPGKISRGGARQNLDSQGRSPNLMMIKRGTVGAGGHQLRISSNKDHMVGDDAASNGLVGRTMSPASNRYVGTSSGMRRYAKQQNTTAASNFNHISHKPGSKQRKTTSVEECPVHAKQQIRRSAVGLNQIDLGGIIIDGRPIDQMGSEEAMQAYLEAQQSSNTVMDIEKVITHSKAKTSFVAGSRIADPFKQGRKKQSQQKQMMTINGKNTGGALNGSVNVNPAATGQQQSGQNHIYHGNRYSQNQSKQITYDPKIIAHMAKMYMVPGNQHHQYPLTQVVPGSNSHTFKKSLFPQHVQQQLLMKDDEPATIYNRTAAAQAGQQPDALMQRAVEDLIKRKIMFQANNAQQLYSQIYNTDVQILCTEQGQLQFQREMANQTSQQVGSNSAQQPHNQPGANTNMHSGTNSSHPNKLASRKTNSVLVGSSHSNSQDNNFQKVPQRRSQQPLQVKGSQPQAVSSETAANNTGAAVLPDGAPHLPSHQAQGSEMLLQKAKRQSSTRMPQPPHKSSAAATTRAQPGCQPQEDAAATMVATMVATLQQSQEYSMQQQQPPPLLSSSATGRTTQPSTTTTTEMTRKQQQANVSRYSTQVYSGGSHAQQMKQQAMATNPHISHKRTTSSTRPKLTSASLKDQQNQQLSTTNAAGSHHYTNLHPSSSRRLLGDSSSRNNIITRPNNAANSNLSHEQPQQPIIMAISQQQVPLQSSQIESGVDYGNNVVPGAKSVFTTAGYESTINKSKQLVMQAPQPETAAAVKQHKVSALLVSQQPSLNRPNNGASATQEEVLASNNSYNSLTDREGKLETSNLHSYQRLQQPGRNHQLKNQIVAGLKSNGSFTNLHTTVSGKLNSENGNLLKNYQSQDNSVALHQQASMELASSQGKISNMAMLPVQTQDQLGQLASHQSQGSTTGSPLKPGSTSNNNTSTRQRHFTENFTSKQQKIRKTKPQYYSNTNNSRIAADGSKSPDSHRPSNSKPGARSRSKQPVLMHESVTPTGTGPVQNPPSNSLSRQAFAGHQVAPLTHPQSQQAQQLYSKASLYSNATKPKLQAAPNSHHKHIQQASQHITHQLDINSPAVVATSNPSTLKSRASQHEMRISQTKSRSQTRKRVHQTQQKSDHGQIARIQRMQSSLDETLQQEAQDGEEQVVVPAAARHSIKNQEPNSAGAQQTSSHSSAKKRFRQPNHTNIGNNQSINQETAQQLSSLANTRKSQPIAANNAGNSNTAQTTSSQSQLAQQPSIQRRKMTIGLQPSSTSGPHYQQIVDKTQALLSYSQKLNNISNVAIISKKVAEPEPRVRESTNCNNIADSKQSAVVGGVAGPSNQSGKSFYQSPLDQAHQRTMHPSGKPAMAAPPHGQRKLRELQNYFTEGQAHSTQQPAISYHQPQAIISTHRTASQVAHPSNALKDSCSNNPDLTLANTLKLQQPPQALGTETVTQSSRGATGLTAKPTRSEVIHAAAQKAKIWLPGAPATTAAANNSTANSSKAATCSPDYTDSMAHRQRRSSKDPYHIQKIQKMGGNSSHINGSTRGQPLPASSSRASGTTNSLATQLLLSSQHQQQKHQLALAQQSRAQPAIGNSQTASSPKHLHSSQPPVSGGKTMPQLPPNNSWGTNSKAVAAGATNTTSSTLMSQQQPLQAVSEQRMTQATQQPSTNISQQQQIAQQNSAQNTTATTQATRGRAKPSHRPAAGNSSGNHNQQLTSTSSHLLPRESIMYSNNPKQ